MRQRRTQTNPNSLANLKLGEGNAVYKYSNFSISGLTFDLYQDIIVISTKNESSTLDFLDTNTLRNQLTKWLNGKRTRDSRKGTSSFGYTESSE